MGVGKNQGWWVPRTQGRAVCVLCISWTGDAPGFPGSTSCRLLPGTGTKQCGGLGRDAGLAEMPPQASCLEQRSLPRLGGGGAVSPTIAESLVIS